MNFYQVMLRRGRSGGMTIKVLLLMECTLRLDNYVIHLNKTEPCVMYRRNDRTGSCRKRQNIIEVWNRSHGRQFLNVNTEPSRTVNSRNTRHPTSEVTRVLRHAKQETTLDERNSKQARAIEKRKCQRSAKCKSSQGNNPRVQTSWISIVYKKKGEVLLVERKIYCVSTSR